MNRSAAAFATVLAAGLLLGACATNGMPADEIPADAVEATRIEANGDTVTEYRVDGRLRALKVVPSRGAPYYLFDRNGDGVVDARDPEPVAGAHSANGNR